MKTRLIKEFQILRLPFAATLLLTILPAAIWPHYYKFYCALLFAFGCVAMACFSFGTEFQHRTIPLLLSQPISRSIIWREKMFTLGTFLGLSLGLLLLFLWFWLSPHNRVDESTIVLLIVLAFIPFCAICTAPFICLLTRNTFQAIVLTLITPVFIYGLGSGLSYWLSKIKSEAIIPVSNLSETIIIGSLLLMYCPLFFWLGLFKWRKLEALDGHSKEMTLPKLEKLLPFKPVIAAWTGPFASLFKKEMHLQKINFLVAGIFIFMATTGACLFPFKPVPADFIMAATFAFYIAMIPMFAGTIPFTEERNWGMAEWHLTLPVPAWKQWTTKLLVILSTNIGLGLVLPLVVYLAGDRLFNKDGGAFVLKEFVNLSVLTLYLLWVVVPVYVASFSKSGTRAVALSVLIIPAVLFSMVGIQGWLEQNDALRILMNIVVIPGYVLLNKHLSPYIYPTLEALLLLCLVLKFTYTNFKQPKRPARFIVYQSLIIYACFALIFLTSTSIEHFSKDWYPQP